MDLTRVIIAIPLTSRIPVRIPCPDFCTVKQLSEQCPAE